MGSPSGAPDLSTPQDEALPSHPQKWLDSSTGPALSPRLACCSSPSYCSRSSPPPSAGPSNPPASAPATIARKCTDTTSLVDGVQRSVSGRMGTSRQSALTLTASLTSWTWPAWWTMTGRMITACSRNEQLEFQDGNG